MNRNTIGVQPQLARSYSDGSRRGMSFRALTAFWLAMME